MKIRYFLTAALFVSALAVGFASNHRAAESAGFARKCYISPLKEARNVSTAVFSGKVISEEVDGDTRKFVFRVEKYWKGKNASEVTVFVHESAYYQAWFKKNGRYLIFAKADDQGRLIVGRCSRSKDIEFAKDDLKKLGKGKIPR